MTYMDLTVCCLKKAVKLNHSLTHSTMYVYVIYGVAPVHIILIIVDRRTGGIGLYVKLILVNVPDRLVHFEAPVVISSWYFM